jgi:Ca-activated chloride channel family protein
MFPMAHLLTMFLSAALAAPQTDARPQRSVKIDVDLVLVNASVTDSDGHSVTGLAKNRFHVWEDKIEQEIQYFSAEEVPVSVGIIFDISSSMEDKISVARDALATFLKTGGPEDEYALVEFNTRPQAAQDFTSDVTEVQNRLALVAPSGSTALYDAVYLGMEKLRHAHNPRKALLLITDGEDNHSHYTFSDVKDILRESDIQLYAIGLGGLPIATATKGHKSGQAVLEDLVDLTGGQAFFTTDSRKVEVISSKISEELRNQYVLGYVPTNSSKNGKWRKLSLKLNPSSKVGVHARSGYFAPID